MTGQCHQPFDRGRDPERAARVDAIETERGRWLPRAEGGSSHFSEPPWRHYTQRGDGRLVTPNDRLEVPCAGTISIRIDAHGGVRVDPSAESLDARIRRWRDPLCRRSS